MDQLNNQLNKNPSKAYIYNNEIKKEKALVDDIFKKEIQINEEIKSDFHNYFNEAQIKINELSFKDLKDEKLKELKKIR